MENFLRIESSSHKQREVTVCSLKDSGQGVLALKSCQGPPRISMARRRNAQPRLFQ